MDQYVVSNHMTQSVAHHLVTRLRVLALFRVLIAFTLCLFTFIFQPGADELDWNLPFFVTLSITGVHLLASIFFVLTQRWVGQRWLVVWAHSQVIWDVLFSTALVYLTGGVFKIIYSLTIFNATFLLFRQGAMAAASLSGILYSVLVGVLASEQVSILYEPVWASVLTNQRTVVQSIIVTDLIFLLTAWASIFVTAKFQQSERTLAAREEEIRELRELMARMVDSVGSGLITLCADGKIRYWNRAAEEIVGLSLEQVKGQRLEDVFVALRSLATLVGQHSGPRHELGEILYERLDRPTKILTVSMYPLCSDATVQKKDEGYLVKVEDCTHVRLMERQVREKEQLALVGEMAARMAHEIRNPLTSISGSVQLLQASDNISQQDTRLMRIVEREADRLNKLLTDFLLFSKPPVAQFEHISLANFIEDAIELFRQGHRDGGVDISVQLDRSITMFADGNQINQMVWNLLQNACEAMDQTGVISVKLTQDQRGVALEVSDEGRGVPPHVRDKLFTPFFTSKVQGSGLGLSLVERIVRSHNGQIDVLSRKNKGTTFRVFWPHKKLWQYPVAEDLHA